MVRTGSLAAPQRGVKGRAFRSSNARGPLLRSDGGACTLPPMKPSITPREARDIAETLAERWGSLLRDGERTRVTAEADTVEARVTVVLENDSGSIHFPMEARLDRSKAPEQDISECTLLLLDVLDELLGAYLESDRLSRPPLDWTPTTFRDVPVQVRGELRDLRAERAAEAWLQRFSGADETDD